MKRIDFICDNNSLNWGKEICGYTCISPEELYEKKDTVVIIMVSHYKDIQKQLIEHDVKNYYFGDLYFNVYSDYHPGHWFKEQMSQILTVYDLLADEDSKKVYQEAICLRIAPHLASTTFGELELPDEYFRRDIFQFSNSEVFVDVGAYNGDSIINFLKCVDNQFEHIYAFELEKKNCKCMYENLKKYDMSKIDIYNCGTSNKKQIICYDGVGTEVHIAEQGVQGELNCIDNILGEEYISFLKMDVEEAEQESLEGAQKIIKKSKPKMCISAYHRLEDLWQIPIQILSYCKNYKLHMRHHSPLVWDTDCYAIYEGDQQSE